MECGQGWFGAQGTGSTGLLLDLQENPLGCFPALAAVDLDQMKRRRRRLDFRAINSAALGVLPSLLHRWLPDGQAQGGEYVARNPRRADRHLGSFRINLQTGRWADFATGDKGGDVISLAAYLADLSQGEAAERLASMLSIRHE